MKNSDDDMKEEDVQDSEEVKVDNPKQYEFKLANASNEVVFQRSTSPANNPMRNALIASFKQRIEETRAKIVQDIAAQGEAEEATYCSICYFNEIISTDKPIPEGELVTVQLECSHRFCSDCTVEQLKQHIETAAIERLVCLDFECK